MVGCHLQPCMEKGCRSNAHLHCLLQELQKPHGFAGALQSPVFFFVRIIQFCRFQHGVDNDFCHFDDLLNITATTSQSAEECRFVTLFCDVDELTYHPTIKLFCMLGFWGMLKHYYDLLFMMNWLGTFQCNNQPLHLVSLTVVGVSLGDDILWVQARHQNYCLCTDANVHPGHFQLYNHATHTPKNVQ